jgi:hypothetical protein
MQAKMALMNGLGSPVKEVRRASSQAVAAIALVEIPQRQWNDCIELLGNSAATVTNNPVVREASLMTLGYICEAIEPEGLGVQTNTILKVLVKTMSQQEEHLPVRLAAIRALLEAVVFIEGNMGVETERSAIMTAVCANTQIPNVDVRVAAFQVLVEIARLYYVHLPAYMQTLFNLTLKVLFVLFVALLSFCFSFFMSIARPSSKTKSWWRSRRLSSGPRFARWSRTCSAKWKILERHQFLICILFADQCASWLRCCSIPFSSRFVKHVVLYVVFFT